jgi:murein DD-endopeptidase MepM/ murein hydrolase activator NlpD
MALFAKLSLLIGAVAAAGYMAFFYEKPVKEAQMGENAISVENMLDALTDTSLAAGFDFPVGNKDGKGSYTSPDGKKYDGWYVATKCAEEYSLGIHTGEDWNGSGGGSTDLGQPVYATAKGEVIFAGECPSPWGNVILIRHKFLENGKPSVVFSQYSHLQKIVIKKGDFVQGRQKIGTIGGGNNNEYPPHLHFEIRKEKMKDYDVDYWPSSNGKSVAWVKEYYELPSDFIKAHRKLTVPARESAIVLAIKSDLKLYYYEKGKLRKTYEMALGQSPRGHKQKQGDLKTPEGEYMIIQKTKGPFDPSDWANAYLGTRWMRVNYPNAYDAANALERKEITASQAAAIKKAILNKQTPPKNTSLGGGIGIHGWKGDWSNDDSERALTWGCISMHNSDLEEFYDLIILNTPIIIMP